MKNKVKIVKENKFGHSSRKFKYKNIRGEIFKDGSGFLEVNDQNGVGGYLAEDSKHKDRVKDVKYLVKFYTQAYKDLLKINKALKKK